MTDRMAPLREAGRMTAGEARHMADEQIAYWMRSPCLVSSPSISDGRSVDIRHRITVREAWNALETGRPYPGGGWERVRAEMVRWLLDQAEPARLAA